MNAEQEIQWFRGVIARCEAKGDKEAAPYREWLAKALAEEKAADDELLAARVWGAQHWKGGTEDNPHVVAIVSIQQRQALLRAYRSRSK